MENKKTGVSLGGLLCVGLTIAFVVLKLCHVIDWSWVWVIAPIWLPVAIIFVVALLAIIIQKIFDKVE